MIDKFKKAILNPATKEAFKSLKPQKTLWGILSLLLFLILPEIIGFTWGEEVQAYCHTYLDTPLPFIKEYYYKTILMFFGKGSWMNLILGILMFIWLFF